MELPEEREQRQRHESRVKHDVINDDNDVDESVSRVFDAIVDDDEVTLENMLSNFSRSSMCEIILRQPRVARRIIGCNSVSCLSVAVRYGMDVVNVTFEKICKDRRVRVTPVWLAARKGFAEMLTALTSFGASRSYVCASCGSTPVLVAARYNHYECFLYLRWSLTTPFASETTFTGRNALMQACKGNSLVIVDNILRVEDKSGEIINATDMFGNCVLHFVRSDRMLLLLLARGAKSRFNEFGISPAMKCAIRIQDTEIAIQLRECCSCADEVRACNLVCSLGLRRIDENVRGLLAKQFATFGNHERNYARVQSCMRPMEALCVSLGFREPESEQNVRDMSANNLDMYALVVCERYVGYVGVNECEYSVAMIFRNYVNDIRYDEAFLALSTYAKQLRVEAKSLKPCGVDDVSDDESETDETPFRRETRRRYRWRRVMKAFFAFIFNFNVHGSQLSDIFDEHAITNVDVVESFVEQLTMCYSELVKVNVESRVLLCFECLDSLFRALRMVGVRSVNNCKRLRNSLHHLYKDCYERPRSSRVLLLHHLLKKCVVFDDVRIKPRDADAVRDVTEMFLEFGLDADLADGDGNTALHFALLQPETLSETIQRLFANAKEIDVYGNINGCKSVMDMLSSSSRQGNVTIDLIGATQRDIFHRRNLACLAARACTAAAAATAAGPHESMVHLRDTTPENVRELIYWHDAKRYSRRY